MVNDIISDSLTRIRNAGTRELETTKFLHSKVVEALVGIFQVKGYIESFNVIEEDKKKLINVVLKCDEKGKDVINELKRVSKLSRRVYKGKEEIRGFKNGYDTIVASTNHGVLVNDEAYEAGVGGEVLCTI